MKALIVPILTATLAIVATAPHGSAFQAVDAGLPCRDGWTPPATARTVRVKNARQLADAIGGARPGTTVLLADGEYRLDSMIDIAVPQVVVRSASGDRSRVVLRGDGMTEQRVGVALSVSAPDVTIADVTIGQVGYHGIQIRGERAASRAVVHNVHVIDTGQQLVKGSAGAGPAYADEGLIACSTFEYSEHAPSDYTNGVDVLAGRGWIVRDNRFERIRGPETGRWAAGPAILFWANSQDTIVERNLIVDSFRGIAFGLGPGVSNLARHGERVIDHLGGRIRNNVLVNLHPWADEGIEANSAPGVAIDHNTVLVNGSLDWSISLRFPATDATARNNLTTHPIALRDGGHSWEAGNVRAGSLSWFRNPASADLRLADPGVPPVGAGIALPEVGDDFDRSPRPLTGRPTAGAFEPAPQSEAQAR